MLTERQVRHQAFRNGIPTVAVEDFMKMQAREGEMEGDVGPYATAYSNERGFSIRFEAFRISIPTMLPSLS
mgnify:CR=1